MTLQPLQFGFPGGMELAVLLIVLVPLLIIGYLIGRNQQTDSSSSQKAREFEKETSRVDEQLVDLHETSEMEELEDVQDVTKEK